MTDFDLVIVGAGIAGASVAAELSPHHSVLLLEAEAHPGYHSTGRSAAFWDECYGGPDVQPLTSASGRFLTDPPQGFADAPLLHPRGALYIGTGAQQSLAEEMLDQFAGTGVRIERADGGFLERRVPGIRDGWHHGLLVPGCQDIDVAALHAAYLRKARQNGVELRCNARLQKARRVQGKWQIEAGGEEFEAATLINAAGAWADDVATMAGVKPVGLTAFRRTIAQLSVDPAPPPDLPLVIALDGSFYFKSEAGGKLWLSPHDETATPPCDAAPEELDVAIAIDRLQQVVDWKVSRVEHKWAGLRTFAPDRLPVIGPDPACPAFFWLAGQGGFGIQTAPAAAMLAASMLSSAVAPPEGVDPARYMPSRFS